MGPRWVETTVGPPEGKGLEWVPSQWYRELVSPILQSLYHLLSPSPLQSFQDPFRSYLPHPHFAPPQTCPLLAHSTGFWLGLQPLLAGSGPGEARPAPPLITPTSNEQRGPTLKEAWAKIL